MELRHLRYFLAAAQSLNFTRASYELNVTQPTLSHQIKQLEEILGSQLFDRVGRSVRLTTAGELFMEHSKRVLKEVELAVQVTQELENLQRGKLVFGVFSSLSTSHLPPIVSDFSALHPGVTVTMLQLPTGVMEKRLREGELSFGIAYGPPASDQIVAEELLRERMALVVGAAHPLFGQPSVEIADLSRYGLIMLTSEYISRRLIESAFIASGATPRIAMEMNAIEPILATVRCSKLGTILSERLVKGMPGLHPVVLSPTIVRTVALFTRQHAYMSAAAETMVNLIKKSFQKDHAPSAS